MLLIVDNILHSYLAFCQPLPVYNRWPLCRAKNGEPYTAKDLNRIWKSACKVSGTEIRLYNAVRHSLGCQLLDEGHDMEMVRDVLGHTATNTTRRYAKRSQHSIAHVLNFRVHVEAIQRQKYKDSTN